jgi:hypothetical protein
MGSCNGLEAERRLAERYIIHSDRSHGGIPLLTGTGDRHPFADAPEANR